MFKWSDRYNWMFSGGCVDSIGPNDADTGIYEGHPYKSLAKEVLQNSMDAKDPKLPETTPVEVEFSCLKVSVDEIPGFKRLNEVVGKCAEYYNSGDDGEKVGSWKEKSDQLIAQDEVYILKISDYNTTGLDGVTKLRDTGWSGLVREKYASNKGNGKGGSHGVGKFAPYSFSALRTVLYSTKNTDGETAFQGKTVLTSFVENGQIYHNVGVFGNKEIGTFPPILDMQEVPESFRRDSVGTDVIVVGFDRDENWKEEITVSILQYCFYAIYLGLLVVRISDENKLIELNKETLNDHLLEYQKWYDNTEHTDDFQFTAPQFYSLLSNPKMKPFSVNYRNMGEMNLFLVVDPDIDGRVIYEMRKFGMGIQEDKNWRISTHFMGLLFATGKGAIDDKPCNNIDSYLRKCEDTAHNEWGAAYYKGHEQEAKNILDGIHNWIRECIKSMIPKIEGDSIDAFGLSRYLQNTNNAGDNTEEENAFTNYEPMSVEAKKVKDPTQKEVPTLVKTNGRGKGNKKKKKKKRGNGGNPNPDNKRGRKMGKIKPVDIGRVWTPYGEGKYHICFTPSMNYSQLQLRIGIGGDEQGADTAPIRSAILNGKKLKTYYGNIEIGAVKKEEPVDVIVELENGERGGLEVQAYVKQ